MTGDSRGLGAAIARELGSTHRILVGGTNEATVESMVAELDDAAPFVADLRDDEAVARAAAGVERVDVLVHNAGVEAAKPIADTTRDDWRAIFEINVFAVAQLTALLLPKLRESNGHVLTINSGMGFRSGARGGLYAGSKFALRAFTDALREDERGRVRVTSIHPGRVDTDMQRAMMARDGREYQQELYIRPESVAATVRLAVDTTPEASIDELQIRPVTTT
ncbi:MAG: SDR family oxidoreductase [Propionibacterium sp.]|nr:SDR family oxidoreductase [Propionibacterium sp.]